jgi:hypothetical protein
LRVPWIVVCPSKVVAEVVRAGVGVARVVGGHAARVSGATVEVDPQPTVVEDGVAEVAVVCRARVFNYSVFHSSWARGR